MAEKKKLVELTDEDLKKILDEYHAPPEKRSKMSQQEIMDLAKRLNEKINVPFINETREEKILVKIVKRVDGFLYDNLPNELYDLVASLDEGISDEEAKRLIKRLSKLANRHIDIPYIPEAAEYVAIRFVVSVIINAARENWNLLKAKEAASAAQISEEVLSESDHDAGQLVFTS